LLCILVLGEELNPEVEAAVKAHWQSIVGENYDIVVS